MDLIAVEYAARISIHFRTPSSGPGSISHRQRTNAKNTMLGVHEAIIPRKKACSVVIGVPERVRLSLPKHQGLTWDP